MKAFISILFLPIQNLCVCDTFSSLLCCRETEALGHSQGLTCYNTKVIDMRKATWFTWNKNIKTRVVSASIQTTQKVRRWAHTRGLLRSQLSDATAAKKILIYKWHGLWWEHDKNQKEQEIFLHTSVRNNFPITSPKGTRKKKFNKTSKKRALHTHGFLHWNKNQRDTIIKTNPLEEKKNVAHVSETDPVQKCGE